ncbi:MAG: hypothetical protein LBQ60_11715 [Bacteroidales bacterium]|jgi:transglutaminase/protease-like cytokinesis protein 3|nr:hypothetical protein [Bacteroidales bacterium]
MKKLITLFLLIITFTLNAQIQNNVYEEVDKKVTELINSSDNNTIQEFVKFINDNFSTETDKLRATFIWIVKNFEYDVENMFAINFYSEPQEIIDAFLKNRKGICMHFAYLFNEVGNQLGIRTYIISGYTRQKDFIDYVPHVWCASLVDSKWYLFDPTWGSGYIQNNKLIKEVNNYYFKTLPENSIKSHMPFDFLWQFLNYPISSQEFYEGRTEINKEKPFFNYVDTLEVYENATKIEQLISTNRRIEQNGVKNTLTYNQLQDNIKNIEYYKNQLIVEFYNSAVYSYNEGIGKLNRFVDYRNKQFKPQKTESEIREMVESVEKSLTESQNLLQNIITTDLNTINSTNQLKNSINEATTQLNEQKAFVNKYFSTKKAFRKSLFYKYTWMGIPLN